MKEGMWLSQSPCGLITFVNTHHIISYFDIFWDFLHKRYIIMANFLQLHFAFILFQSKQAI